MRTECRDTKEKPEEVSREKGCSGEMILTGFDGSFNILFCYIEMGDEPNFFASADEDALVLEIFLELKKSVPLQDKEDHVRLDRGRVNPQLFYL